MLELYLKGKEGIWEMRVRRDCVLGMEDCLGRGMESGDNEEQRESQSECSQEYKRGRDFH